MSTNARILDEENERGANLPSNKETGENIKATDMFDQLSPTRKRRQEESESGLPLGGQSNGKEQATTGAISKNALPFSFKEKGSLGISMKLAPVASKKQKTESPLQKKTGSAASAFNDSDDEEHEEEMPREAKMRMRNLGKETPTSAGPNSFNKGKRGFTHHQKVWEKTMKSPTSSSEANEKK